MTRKELAKKVSLKMDLDILTVDEVIKHATSEITEALMNEKEVFIRGFGTFKTIKRKAKLVRNINAGTSFTLPEHKVPSWKPSQAVKKLLLG